MTTDKQTAKDLLHELHLEAAVTRRFLENVPFDKLDYKPAEKSESLGRLAIHVAELEAWWTDCLEHDNLDFLNFEPKDITSKEELLSYFDDLLVKAKKSLSGVTEAALTKEWSIVHGQDVQKQPQ